MELSENVFNAKIPFDRFICVPLIHFVRSHRIDDFIDGFPSAFSLDRTPNSPRTGSAKALSARADRYIAASTVSSAECSRVFDSRFRPFARLRNALTEVNVRRTYRSRENTLNYSHASANASAAVIVIADDSHCSAETVQFTSVLLTKPNGWRSFLLARFYVPFLGS